MYIHKSKYDFIIRSNDTKWGFVVRRLAPVLILYLSFWVPWLDMFLDISRYNGETTVRLLIQTENNVNNQ